MHVRCTGCLQGARHLKSAGRQGHGCCVPTAWRAPGHPTHLDSSHILTHHTSCLLACKNGMALSRSCAEGNHSLACVKERHGRLSYMCPELWGATPLLACKNGMALTRSCAEGNHSLACVKGRHGRLSYMCPELWGATPLLACKNGMALTRSCAEGNHSLACVKGRHGRLSYVCPELWGATPLLACRNAWHGTHSHLGRELSKAANCAHAHAVGCTAFAQLRSNDGGCMVVWSHGRHVYDGVA